MSIGVSLEHLAETLAQFRFGYLLTTTDDGQARVVAAYVTVDGAQLVVADAGPRTRANAEARPSVTLLWPPTDPDGYSLIVDGTASVREDAVVVVPTRAVLHRPAPPRPDVPDGGCASDCVEVPLGT